MTKRGRVLFLLPKEGSVTVKMLSFLTAMPENEVRAILAYLRKCGLAECELAPYSDKPGQRPKFWTRTE